MTDPQSTKDAMDKLLKDPEFQKKLDERLKDPAVRSKLAMSMIDPIRRRRFPRPLSVCKECGKPHWEAVDESKHTAEECLLYYVMES